MIFTKWEILRGFRKNDGFVVNNSWLFITVITAFVVSACSIVKPVEFKKVNNFKIEENNGKIIIRSNLTLYNPNGFEFVVNNANIDVYAEGVNLGKLQIPDTVQINKKEKFQGDFKVEITLIKLLLAGKSIIPKLKKGQISLEFKGYIEADVLWMHKKFNVNYQEDLRTK